MQTARKGWDANRSRGYVRSADPTTDIPLSRYTNDRVGNQLTDRGVGDFGEQLVDALYCLTHETDANGDNPSKLE